MKEALLLISTGARHENCRRPLAMSEEACALCKMCKIHVGRFRKKKRISGGGWSSCVLDRLSEKFIFYVAFRLRVSNSALCKKAFIIRPEMFVCVRCSFNMRHNGNSSQTEMKRVTLGLQRFPSRPDSPPGVRVIAHPSYTCLYVAGSVSLTAVTSGCIPNTTGRVGGCAASRCDG